MTKMAGYQQLVIQLFNQRSKLKEYYQIQLFRPLLKWLQDDAKQSKILLSEKKLNLKIYQSFMSAQDANQMARHLLLNLNSLIIQDYPEMAAAYYQALTKEYGEIIKPRNLTSAEQKLVGNREQEITKDLEFLLNSTDLKKAS